MRIDTSGVANGVPSKTRTSLILPSEPGAAHRGEYPIFVNTRVLGATSGAVQRYLEAVLARLPDDRQVVPVAPQRRSRGIFAHLWEQWRLPRVARQGLLWSPCNSGPLDVRRHVVTIHDLGPIEHPRFWSRRYVTWYAYMMPRVAKSATHVLTVSHFMRERIHDRLGVPLERITAIPLAPDVTDETALCERAPFTERSLPYVLALGSMSARRRLDDVLEAWRRVAPELPEVRLRIVGAHGASRNGRRAFRSLCPSVERVDWLGHVPDPMLQRMFRGALAFVSAASYEGFGRSPLRALAFGTPVIASDIPAHREVLADAPVYFDLGDRQDLADAIGGVVGSERLRADLGARGRARAAEFSWDDTARRTLEVLDGCLP